VGRASPDAAAGERPRGLHSQGRDELASAGCDIRRLGALRHVLRPAPPCGPPAWTSCRRSRTCARARARIVAVFAG
jgi:hypothetical protein